MAAIAIGHPLQSRNTQAGDSSEVLGKRAQDLPIGLIESLIGGNRKASAYDEDVAAANPTEVLGKRAPQIDLDIVGDLLGDDLSDLQVKRAQDLPIGLIESLIGGNRKASAYDEDVAAANPTEVLGKRAPQVDEGLLGDIDALLDTDVLVKRAQDLPIGLIESLIGGNRKASAYDEDVAAANPTEVLGKRAPQIDDGLGDVLGDVLGDIQVKRAQDLPIGLIESLIGGNRKASAYDEDVAAADPAAVLGKDGSQE